MWWLPLAMAGGGALMNAWGGANNQAKDQSAGWFEEFNRRMGYDPNNRDMNAGRSNQFWNALSGSGPMGASSWLGGAQSYNNMAQGAMGDALRSANRDAGDIWASFARTQPAMSSWANMVANDSMSQMGTAAEDYARNASRNAQRGITSDLARSGAFGGGAMNGAALAAIAEGTANPLLQTQAQLANMRNAAFMGAFLPMAQAGYGRELNRTNDYMNLANTALGGMQGMSNVGLNLAGFMNDQGQQMMVAPELVYEPNLWQTMGGALMQGGARGMGNMDWSKIFGGGQSRQPGVNQWTYG